MVELPEKQINFTTGEYQQCCSTYTSWALPKCQHRMPTPIYSKSLHFCYKILWNRRQRYCRKSTWVPLRPAAQINAKTMPSIQRDCMRMSQPTVSCFEKYFIHSHSAFWIVHFLLTSIACPKHELRRASHMTMVLYQSRLDSSAYRALVFRAQNVEPEPRFVDLIRGNDRDFCRIRKQIENTRNRLGSNRTCLRSTVDKHK